MNIVFASIDHFSFGAGFNSL